MDYKTIKAPIEKSLGVKDFIASLGASEANKWTDIGKFRVLQGQRLTIPRGRAYNLYMCARATFSGAAAGADAPVTLANNALPDLILTPRYQTPTPTAYHVDIAVWAEVAGVWQRCTISSIDEANETLTYIEPANTTSVEIEYTHTRGLTRFAVNTSQGNAISQSNVVLGDLSISSLNARDQYDAENFSYMPSRQELPLNFELVLAVNSPHTHIIDDRSNSHIRIQSAIEDVQELDEVGVRRRAQNRISQR